MKSSFITCCLINVLISSGNLLAVDPVIDFKIGLAIPTGDKILKWEVDLDGDSKNEIFLSLKSDYQEAKDNHDAAGWVLFQPVGVDAAYQECKGVSEAPDVISSVLPQIDHELCFIGQITEIGQRGVVTIQYSNPREGPSIGIIYAYTVEGDHLKKKELARFPVSPTPHALFSKYLADDKRTIITPMELTP